MEGCIEAMEAEEFLPWARRRQRVKRLALSVLCHAVDVAYLGLGGIQDGGYT